MGENDKTNHNMNQSSSSEGAGVISSDSSLIIHIENYSADVATHEHKSVVRLQSFNSVFHTK